MKKLVFALCASSAACSLFACLGDDSVVVNDAGPQEDASFDASVADGSKPPTGNDGGSDAGTLDASPPPRLLVSYNGSSTTEMVAFNLQTNTVDGRLTVPSYLGTSFVTPTRPFFLGEEIDSVLALDPNQPWKPVSSWNVAGADKGDGGVMDSYADPTNIAISAGNKAYVLRYTRKEIYVIDPTAVADGGAPTKTIDLSAYVDPKDTDGVPDMTAAYYHAGRQRLYVLLGNIDKTKFDPTTFDLICSGLYSSIIAIDTTTDTVVSLNGAAQGGGIKLPLYNPLVGVKLAYDTTNDRLLALGAGCNAGPTTDGGAPGALQQQEIDEVKLATGVADKVLDLNAAGFPTQFYLVDDSNAILGFFGQANQWATSSSTLGATIPNAPDYFTNDGQGNLIGTQQVYYSDGGTGPINLVRVTVDGGSTTIGSGVNTVASPFIGGVDVWPSP